MVKYAKLAGMASALAIGLGGGALLAVMNPLIPNKDATQIEAAPMGGQSGGQQQDAVPVIGGGGNAAVVLPDASKPDAGRADMAPDMVKQNAGKVQAGAASELTAPTVVGNATSDLTMPKSDSSSNTAPAGALSQPVGADLAAQSPALQDGAKVQVGNADAMVAPEITGATAAPSLPTQLGSANLAAGLPELPTVNVPRAPDVSTRSATPLAISEPQVDISIQRAEPAQPSVDLALDIIAPKVAGRDMARPAPQKIVQAPDVVAALPTVPEHKRRVNKSGTFDTRSSRLATNGGVGFTQRKPSEPSIKFPKISGRNPEGVNAEPASAPPAEIGALRRNAVAFAGADKPLLSIVLIDIGKEGLPNETLKKLTIPAAFALPADQAGVGRVAQGYRDAGFEVLALSPRAVGMSLSGGLDQEQVNAVVAKIFTDLPQAIGLIDRPAADLQKDRKLVKSVVASFAETGHGLLTYSGGLNPAPRAAKSANVAAASVYRVLDGKGESPEIIMRVLNRAVFEARHNGQVIVVGTTAPQTVAAIVNWTLSTKARGVALAPVSASLLLGNP